MQLSERAKQLIPKARIVSFTTWKDRYPEQAHCYADLFEIAIFQSSDDEGRYLTDEDINALENLAPNMARSLQQARSLREKAPQIVQQARQQVLNTFPGITEPGGALYPLLRAEACWRDFWHFLRCITYGIAGQNEQFISQEGLDNMHLLYQELRVPLDAMVLGLENLKTYSLESFGTEPENTLGLYFDRLIDAMKQFCTNSNYEN